MAKKHVRKAIKTKDLIYNRMLELARQRGIIVASCPLSTGTLGVFMHHRTKGVDAIFLNSRLNAKDKRETLGHELGHYMLHKEALILQKSNNGNDDKKEVEADKFSEKLIKIIERSL